MIDPVIHISKSTHEAFKAACRTNRVRMRDIADRLIRNWIDGTATPPVPAVKKRQTRPLPKTNTFDPYTAPPFWAGRNGA